MQKISTSTNVKDYYKRLEISINATTDDIKKSYRRLALKYHPDINKSYNASSIFIEIHEAYEILVDIHKRSIYDELYKKTFLNESAIVAYETEEFKNWQNTAKSNAYQYSKMSWDEYKYQVLDILVKVYDTTKKSAKIGCGLFLGLFFMISALYGIWTYIEQFILISKGEASFHFGLIFGLILIFIFGLFGYILLKGIGE